MAKKERYEVSTVGEGYIVYQDGKKLEAIELEIILNSYIDQEGRLKSWPVANAPSIELITPPITVTVTVGGASK